MIAFQISVCWWTRAEPRRQVLVRVPIPSLEALPRRTGIVHRHKPVTNLLPVPVCPLVKKRAALQGISTANYKLIAATQCRDALYGGIEWDDFTDSVKTYDTQGTDMVCCAKQGIAHTPPSCTNTCPPGETRGPYPGCVCSVGSPPPTCTNTCPPGQTPNPSRGCRCMRPYCNARLRLFWETTPCGIDKRLLLRAQVSGVAHYCCAPLLCVGRPVGKWKLRFQKFYL